jgi:hypothetical protein
MISSPVFLFGLQTKEIASAISRILRISASARPPGVRSNLGMGTKTTYVCDCCFREADNNLGWAQVHVNGATGGKQQMPDDDRDLCEVCWSPLQTLMKKVHDDARAKQNSEPRT